MKSSLTPELFSQAQIDFLRGLGVRVVYCGSNQWKLSPAANFPGLPVNDERNEG